MQWLVEGGALKSAPAPLPEGAFSGRGLYETFLNDGGRVPFLSRHLARMWDGFAWLGMSVPGISQVELAALIERECASGGLARSRRIRITAFESSAGEPAALYVTSRQHSGYSEEQYERGFSLIIAPWRRDPGWAIAELKTIGVAANTAARQLANRAGCDEAVFLSPTSKLLEGAFSNIFIVAGGVLWTPPATGILPGITRAVVLESAFGGGMSVREGEISLDQLIASDEAFVTSAALGVMPTTRLRPNPGEQLEVPLGAGEPGKITLAMAAAYRGLAARV